MQFIIRFFRIAITPFIHQHHGNGCYWLWMDLESAHYTNDTLTFLWQQGTCFILKDAHSPCLASVRPVEDLWPALKKAYDGGLEATSIPLLKQNQEGPTNSRSDDPLQYSQSALGSLHLRWLLGGLPLDIEPRPIRH